MRKRTFFLLILLLSLQHSLWAQPITREMYTKVVNSNSSFNCPYRDFWWTVEKITYKGDYLHYHLKMPHKIWVGHTQTEIRDFCADRIRYFSISPKFTYLYSKLPEVNSGLVYDIKLQNEQEEVDSSFSIRFSASEVRQLIADQKKPQYKNGTRWEARKEVEYLTNATNRKCRTSNEIGVDSVSFVQDTLTLHYNTQSLFGLNGLDEIRNNRQEIYKNLKKVVILEAGIDLWVDAEICLTYSFHEPNTSQTEDFTFDYNTLEELAEWSDDLKPATPEQIDAYLKEITKDPTLYAGMTENNMTLAEISYQDRVLQAVYYISEEDFNYSVTPEEYQTIKSTMTTALNYFLQKSFETPEIFDDAYITLEQFYQYFKGYNALFTDPATKKGLEFFISSEELQNEEIIHAKTSAASSKEQARKDIIAAQLAKEIKDYNDKYCPATFDEFTMEELTFENGDIHAYGSLDINQFPDTSAFKANLIDKLYTTINIQLIEEIGTRIIYHIRKSSSNDTLMFTISPDELIAREQFLNDPTKATQILLDIISEVQSQLPFEVDEATVWDSITLTDKELIYQYFVDMDDDQFNQEVKENGDIIRVNALTNLEAEMPESLLKACVQSNRGITYRYSSKSNRYSWEINFTPQELEQILSE